MKNRCDASRVKQVAGLLAVGLAAGWASSAIVFEAGFNGPSNGTGGPYDKMTLGGTCTFNSDATKQVTSQVSKTNPLTGGGGYFNCAMASTNFTQLNTVTFTPGSAASSLNAMTSVTNGDRVINGGFDFFFRSSKTVSNAEMRALDSDNRSVGGLRFTYGSFLSGSTRSIRLEMLSPGLLAGGESGASNQILNVSGAFPMESNTVYHLGLTFSTDTNGTVTAKIWAQAGTNAIDLTTATPVATLTFGINENIVSNGFETGAFIFSQLRPAQLVSAHTQDFDQFRIYNATPTSFGALGDYAWRTSSPQTVLQADFGGEGGGTGGLTNMVSLGGTGALYDYAGVSDASVIAADPFRSRARGYLSVLTTTNTGGGVYGHAVITPASATSSLACMSVVTNGQRMLRGGFDFFFRSDHTITNYNEFRPIDTDNRPAGGLRLALHTQTSSTFQLEVIAATNGLYSGGEGGAPVSSLASDFSAALLSNTVYHVAMSFDATDAGSVTAAVWLKPGTGAIDTRTEIPVGALTFGLNESLITNGLTSGAFDLGKLRNDGAYPARQDFDALRVYRDTPVTFSAFPVPPPGTLTQVF